MVFPQRKTALKENPMNEVIRFLSPEELAELEIWPEAALLHLPAAGSDEEVEFHRSLQQGQREPITIVNGKLLDGRRRVAFAIAAGVGLNARIRDDVEDRVDFVLDIQFNRRETSPAQRAMVVARPEVRLHFQKKARNRQGRRNLQPGAAESGQWTEVAGRAAKCGRTSVQHAVTVWDRGVAELQRLVLSNEVAVSTAAVLASHHDVEEQRTICEGGAAKVRSVAAALQRQHQQAALGRDDGSEEADAAEAEDQESDEADEDGGEDEAEEEEEQEEDEEDEEEIARDAGDDGDDGGDVEPDAEDEDDEAEEDEGDAGDVESDDADNDARREPAPGSGRLERDDERLGVQADTETDAKIALLTERFFGRKIAVRRTEPPKGLRVDAVVRATPDLAAEWLLRAPSDWLRGQRVDVIIDVDLDLGGDLAQKLLCRQHVCVIRRAPGEKTTRVLVHLGGKEKKFSEVFQEIGAVVRPAVGNGGAQ